jgi:hypothetical protein
MISWEDYNKLIIEKDVKVYDYHKRISYYRLNQLNNELNIEQKGGGDNINYKIKNIESHNLEKVIVYLIHKNYEKVKLLLT